MLHSMLAFLYYYTKKEKTLNLLMITALYMCVSLLDNINIAEFLYMSDLIRSKASLFWRIVQAMKMLKRETN